MDCPPAVSTELTDPVGTEEEEEQGEDEEEKEKGEENNGAKDMQSTGSGFDFFGSLLNISEWILGAATFAADLALTKGKMLAELRAALITKLTELATQIAKKAAEAAARAAKGRPQNNPKNSNSKDSKSHKKGEKKQTENSNDDSDFDLDDIFDEDTFIDYDKFQIKLHTLYDIFQLFSDKFIRLEDVLNCFANNMTSELKNVTLFAKKYENMSIEAQEIRVKCGNKMDEEPDDSRYDKMLKGYNAFVLIEEYLEGLPYEINETAEAVNDLFFDAFIPLENHSYDIKEKIVNLSLNALYFTHPIYNTMEAVGVLTTEAKNKTIHCFNPYITAFQTWRDDIERLYLEGIQLEKNTYSSLMGEYYNVTSEWQTVEGIFNEFINRTEKELQAFKDNVSALVDSINNCTIDISRDMDLKVEKIIPMVSKYLTLDGVNQSTEPGNNSTIENPHINPANYQSNSKFDPESVIDENDVKDYVEFQAKIHSLNDLFMLLFGKFKRLEYVYNWFSNNMTTELNNIDFFKEEFSGKLVKAQEIREMCGDKMEEELDNDRYNKMIEGFNAYVLLEDYLQDLPNETEKIVEFINKLRDEIITIQDQSFHIKESIANLTVNSTGFNSKIYNTTEDIRILTRRAEEKTITCLSPYIPAYQTWQNDMKRLYLEGAKLEQDTYNSLMGEYFNVTSEWQKVEGKFKEFINRAKIELQFSTTYFEDLVETINNCIIHVSRDMYYKTKKGIIPKMKKYLGISNEQQNKGKSTNNNILEGGNISYEDFRAQVNSTKKLFLFLFRKFSKLSYDYYVFNNSINQDLKDLDIFNANCSAMVRKVHEIHIEVRHKMNDEINNDTYHQMFENSNAMNWLDTYLENLQNEIKETRVAINKIKDAINLLNNHTTETIIKMSSLAVGATNFSYQIYNTTKDVQALATEVQIQSNACLKPYIPVYQTWKNDIKRLYLEGIHLEQNTYRSLIEKYYTVPEKWQIASKKFQELKENPQVSTSRVDAEVKKIKSCTIEISRNMSYKSEAYIIPQIMKYLIIPKSPNEWDFDAKGNLWKDENTDFGGFRAKVQSTNDLSFYLSGKFTRLLYVYKWFHSNIIKELSDVNLLLDNYKDMLVKTFEIHRKAKDKSEEETDRNRHAQMIEGINEGNLLDDYLYGLYSETQETTAALSKIYDTIIKLKTDSYQVKINITSLTLNASNFNKQIYNTTQDIQALAIDVRKESVACISPYLHVYQTWKNNFKRVYEEGIQLKQNTYRSLIEVNFSVPTDWQRAKEKFQNFINQPKTELNASKSNFIALAEKINNCTTAISRKMSYKSEAYIIPQIMKYLIIPKEQQKEELLANEWDFDAEGNILKDDNINYNEFRDKIKSTYELFFYLSAKFTRLSYVYNWFRSNITNELSDVNLLMNHYSNMLENTFDIHGKAKDKVKEKTGDYRYYQMLEGVDAGYLLDKYLSDLQIEIEETTEALKEIYGQISKLKANSYQIKLNITSSTITASKFDGKIYYTTENVQALATDIRKQSVACFSAYIPVYRTWKNKVKTIFQKGIQLKQNTYKSLMEEYLHVPTEWEKVKGKFGEFINRTTNELQTSKHDVFAIAKQIQNCVIAISTNMSRKSEVDIIPELIKNLIIPKDQRNEESSEIGWDLEAEHIIPEDDKIHYDMFPTHVKSVNDLYYFLFGKFNRLARVYNWFVKNMTSELEDLDLFKVNYSDKVIKAHEIHRKAKDKICYEMDNKTCNQMLEGINAGYLLDDYLENFTNEIEETEAMVNKLRGALIKLRKDSFQIRSNISKSTINAIDFSVDIYNAADDVRALARDAEKQTSACLSPFIPAYQTWKNNIKRLYLEGIQLEQNTYRSLMDEYFLYPTEWQKVQRKFKEFIYRATKKLQVSKGNVAALTDQIQNCTIGISRNMSYRSKTDIIPEVMRYLLIPNKQQKSVNELHLYDESNILGDDNIDNDEFRAKIKSTDDLFFYLSAKFTRLSYIYNWFHSNIIEELSDVNLLLNNYKDMLVKTVDIYRKAKVKSEEETDKNRRDQMLHGIYAGNLLDKYFSDLQFEIEDTKEPLKKIYDQVSKLKKDSYQVKLNITSSTLNASKFDGKIYYTTKNVQALATDIRKQSVACFSPYIHVYRNWKNKVKRLFQKGIQLKQNTYKSLIKEYLDVPTEWQKVEGKFIEFINRTSNELQTSKSDVFAIAEQIQNCTIAISTNMSRKSEKDIIPKMIKYLIIPKDQKNEENSEIGWDLEAEHIIPEDDKIHYDMFPTHVKSVDNIYNFLFGKFNRLALVYNWFEKNMTRELADLHFLKENYSNMVIKAHEIHRKAKDKICYEMDNKTYNQMLEGINAGYLLDDYLENFTNEIEETEAMVNKLRGALIKLREDSFQIRSNISKSTIKAKYITVDIYIAADDVRALAREAEKQTSACLSPFIPAYQTWKNDIKRLYLEGIQLKQNTYRSLMKEYFVVPNEWQNIEKKLKEFIYRTTKKLQVSKNNVFALADPIKNCTVAISRNMSYKSKTVIIPKVKDCLVL